ncbi:UDP-N-acetylmuramate--L-alanine ligase [Patescibacteria group bacterium]|nr:UDP-N-acetylmuramate--L-alanine ligase [Patescibacteria group bacterium]MBU1705910.1 UDP-N-acetylmuramate--L-alanine ligase [Patescibacteria group bacterium]
MRHALPPIHFIGIGGIGMSALAKLMKSRGHAVTGSDLVLSDITKDLEQFGIQVFEDHLAQNVPTDADLVVYSGAVPESNPERVQAKKLGIKQVTYGQMLGEVSKEYLTIAVSGTNGKSTTTAMLGKILEAAGFDPTVLVGTYVPGFAHGNLRLGQSRFFVVEGCEYQANMLNMEPAMIVLTNIEEDHLDYYRDLDHIRQTFQKFVDKLTGEGKCVVNARDPQSQKLTIQNPVTYGFQTKADYKGWKRITAVGKQAFELAKHGKIILQIPGEFNVENALAAAAAALELGVKFKDCQKALKEFPGAWRRFERVGEFMGATIISDYGHHPTAIEGTLKAAKEFFPKRRIILCFQPHQHSRTKELFDDFVKVLSKAENLIIPEIYGVSGRTEPEAAEISSLDLVKKIPRSEYAPDLPTAEQMLRDKIQKDDVVIIMGAGDVDQIARNLVK